jgi:hypothetical protein
MVSPDTSIREVEQEQYSSPHKKWNALIILTLLGLIKEKNRIGGVMASVLASCAVDRGFIGGVMASVLASCAVDCGFIGGVMASVLASCAVDRGFEPRSGQTKE